MNKYTVSLGRAKKLDKAGWEKETLFNWVKLWSPEKPKGEFNWKLKYQDDRDYSAPIASEILEELPKVLRKKGELSNLRIQFANSFIDTTYEDFYDRQIIRTTHDVKDDIANALADMWLYLKKEKLI